MTTLDAYIASLGPTLDDMAREFRRACEQIMHDLRSESLAREIDKLVQTMRAAEWERRERERRGRRRRAWPRVTERRPPEPPILPLPWTVALRAFV